MLHRGCTSSYIHTKSDIDPAIIAGIELASGDGDSKSARSAPPRGRKDRLRAAIRANEYIGTVYTPDPNRANRIDQIEMSKELRARNPAATIWTGMKPYARHRASTSGLAFVPLHSLSVDSPRVACDATSSPRSHPPPHAPILQVGRIRGSTPRAHFVSPIQQRREARQQQREQQRNAMEQQQHIQQQQTHRVLMPSSTERAARGMDQPTTHSADDFSLDFARPPHAPRLTVAHLPVHVDFALNGGTDSGSSTSRVVVTPRGLTVPDATAIFHRFQAWLVGQRVARDEWRTQAAAERQAHIEQSHTRRMQRQEQRQAKRQANQDASLDPSVDSDVDDDSTPPPPSAVCFTPSLFSYPRLQYDTPHGVIKYQSHIVEVESIDELHAAWKAIEAQLNQHADCRSDSRLKDRIFAFRIDPPPTIESSTDSDEKESYVPADPPLAHHGFSDGTLLGSGSKLLHLLGDSCCSNVLLLLTESGCGIPSLTSNATHTSAKQGHMLRTCKIMIQDFERVRDTIRQHTKRQQQQHANESNYHRDEKTNSIIRAPSPALASEGWVVSRTDSAIDRPIDGFHIAQQHPMPVPPVTLYALPISTEANHLSHPISLSKADGMIPALSLPLSSQSQVTQRELKFMSPEEEDILKSEFLSLLSGHAFLKMNPINLNKDFGKNRPYFMELWQAYCLRVHPPQELPDLAQLHDAHARDSGLIDLRQLPEKESLLRAEVSIGSNLAAGKGGRMATSFQPNAKSHLRIAEKINRLTSGVGGLMLDGFKGDQPDSSGIDPLRTLHASGTVGLSLRKGAGYPGSSVVRAPPRRHHRYDSKLTPRDGEPGGLTFFELEQQEQAELKELTAQQIELASRKTLMHTGRETAPNAAMYLEIQRIRQIEPSHRVESHMHLYHSLLHVVYAFKAKYFLMRLSRSSLMSIAIAHPTHPPFLIRTLVLAIGILIGLPNLHWTSLTHLLRGELPVSHLSSFLSTDQSSWRLYLHEQDRNSGPLPKMITPEKMARTILARDEQEEARRRLYEAYREAAEFAAEQACVPPDESRAALDHPRDVMAHLMGVDITTLQPHQYTQVLTLFSEPTLNPTAIATLPEQHAHTATLLYEWVLLTMRAYNVWHSCCLAFEPLGSSVQMAQVETYSRYIRSIGMSSEDIIAQQTQIECDTAEESTGAPIPALNRINTYTRPPVPRQATRNRSLTIDSAAVSAAIPAKSPRATGIEPTTPRTPHTPHTPHSRGGTPAPVQTNNRPRSGEPPRIGLAATLQGNLLTLLESERPAARSTDEMMGGWLAEGPNSTFGRRRMG